MLSFLKPGQKSGTSWTARLRDGLARTRKVLNTDITELRQVQDDLRSLNDRLESLVEQRTAQLHSSESRLRAALEASGCDRLIETVRGTGYRLHA